MLNKIKNSLLFAMLAVIADITMSCSGGGSSAPAPKVSSLTAPAKIAATTAPLKIVVSWDAVAGATGYKVYYKTAPGVGTGDSNVTVLNGETAWNHTDGLAEGQTYYYRVATIGADGESSLSAEISATVTNAINSGCAPVHEGAAWTKSDCGPVDVMEVFQGTVGDDGSALGSRSMNKVRIQFKLTEANYTQVMSDSEVYFAWFHAAGYNRNEANWHLIAYSEVWSRLITQRFDDACPGNNVAGFANACEDKYMHNDVVFDSTKTFAYDCYWDYSGDQTVNCNVSVTDGSFQTTYSGVPMNGPYYELNEFRVGNFSIFGKDTLKARVSDFRFSVFSSN